ncbi:whey acidic protein-like [Eriocheir sinensis]|uniref:whey acidic protein-like n=1 Tax=Eriocheir sinensis TaxID=95602 RepID=UPI0021C9CFB6|nr:whey acidic protein-like [Eriocheir sinensis]XP_050723634.1 whey acidic protein-like [Eriocheir sinensis]
MARRRFIQLALVLAVLIAAVHAQDSRRGQQQELQQRPEFRPRAQCPDQSRFNRFCFRRFDQCTSDRQCRRGEKCCLVPGCGRECMARGSGPVSKRGQCPFLQFFRNPRCSRRDRIDSCQTDQQCPGTQKCCFVVCNKRCANPV